MPESVFDRIHNSLAEDLGVRPDQLTPEFIHEMRKRMWPHLQLDFGDEYTIDTRVRPLTSAEAEAWGEQCRQFAREILAQGPSSCKGD